MRKGKKHISLIIKFAPVLFLSFFFSFNSKAQVLKSDFEEYNTKNGLSQNLVQAIAQDEKGFMWFGTEDGLNRFDGHDFKIYQHKEQDLNSLVSNSIRTLLADEDGSIWIGTSNGLCKLHPETDLIERFPVDFTDETKFNGAYISAIKKKEDGSLWVSYIGSGVDIMYPDKKEIFHYTIHRDDQYKLTSDMVSSIQFMPDGSTLFGTYSGLEIINTEGNVLKAEEATKKYPWAKAIHSPIKSLLLSRDKQTLWIGTELNGVYKVDLQTNEAFNFNTSNSELESKDILSLYQDSKGNIWVGSDAIYLYDQNANSIIWYNENNLYIKNHTHAIFEDKDQNLWMGTARLGVRKFNYQDSNIKHFHSNQGEESLKSDEILSFNQDELGNIWVGTGGAGLFMLDAEQKGFTPSPLNKELSSQTIKCIYKDPEGYFWLGSWDGGIMKYHPVRQTIEKYHPKFGNFRSHHVWDIKGDSVGNLWVGTLRDGLCYFSPKTKESKYFRYTPGDSTALVNDDVQSVFIDSRKIVWIGTGNGLSILFPGAQSFVNRFKFQSNEKYPLSSNVILCIYEAPDGRIWLGTKGGGIAVMQVNGKEVTVEKVLKESDGLPSNTITAIQEDNKQNIWVSTSNGLAKIDPADFSLKETGQVDGALPTAFLAQANFRTSKGSLLFGSSNGFLMFHPDSLDLDTKIPEVWLTSLEVINEKISPNNFYWDRKILEKWITETEELTLSHEDYAFTIHFSTLTYNRQHTIRYTYFLENLDKEWQYTTSDKRFVHYTNLQPGRYTLKLKASYDGQNWSEEITKLNIVITPPWWQTWWFRLVAFLLLAAAIFSVYKGRVSFLEKQSRKLEKLVASRTLELHRSNKEIQVLLEEVAEQNDDIENKNFELRQINEELETQRDDLQSKSAELEKARFKLTEINTSLELLVDKRTQKLNHTVEELETFLYRASHDLRGPIATMLGIINISEMETAGQKGGQSQYDLLRRAVHKLERMLQKLLQKYTIQKEDVFLEPFSNASLNCLVQKISKHISSFRQKDFEVKIQRKLNFETDAKLLEIILFNLLENAFFFSERAVNKKVLLEVRQTENNILISVSDNGAGVKKELESRIFHMFYRGNELSKGNGLGLYLVKCALEKLNGFIQLETREGECCRFQVTLPLPERTNSEEEEKNRSILA